MSEHQHLLTLIERLGNLLRNESRNLGKAAGLQPVHWQVLDYLARCNRMSDTPLALSQYLGISKGTTSQSLLVLQNKGLLTKLPDRRDRRTLHLRLSASGRRMLTQLDALTSRRLSAELDERQREACESCLENLLRSLIRRQQGKTFGVCHSCRHFQWRQEGYRCGLIDEPLTIEESEKICHEHQP